jgi:hypothetical protein
LELERLCASLGQSVWPNNAEILNPSRDSVANKLIAQVPHLVLELGFVRDRIDALEAKLGHPVSGDTKSTAEVSFHDYCLPDILIQNYSRGKPAHTTLQPQAFCIRTMNSRRHRTVWMRSSMGRIDLERAR